MEFHSANFLFFFIALLIPYLFIKRARIGLLAAANVLFYAVTGVGPLLLFVAVTLVTYFVMHAMRKEGWRWLFWIGIGVNIANLLFFKYTLLIVDTLQSWGGVTWIVRDDLAAKIVLPIGISFYTFQLISYLIDVRRGDFAPTRSLLSFWVYIALFPQLIAGPIMRGNELMPQLDEIRNKQVRWQEIKYGMMLILSGLVKKVLLADQIASIANPLFAQSAVSGTEAWIAAFAFGFQIYFDFSAYSDMALGLGHMLGIKLVLNFNTPYLSSNPSEFWTRWHISLSRWIRDYIYIGLGGNRKGPVRVQFNLLAAMLISGLWHGAMWTFVLWGGIHGVLLILYKGWRIVMSRLPVLRSLQQSFIYRVVAVIVFFHMISWTWVFFRAESMAQAWHMTKQMIRTDWLTLYQSPEMLWIGALFMLHIIEFLVRNYEEKSARLWHWVPFPLRSAVYFVVTMTIFYFLKGETHAFIYFQF